MLQCSQNSQRDWERGDQLEVSARIVMSHTTVTDPRSRLIPCDFFSDHMALFNCDSLSF
jgi:hypothetical protein